MRENVIINPIFSTFVGYYVIRVLNIGLSLSLFSLLFTPLLPSNPIYIVYHQLSQGECFSLHV